MELTQEISVVAPEPTIKIANFFMQIHNYWKTKVRQVHASWKIVTDKVELEKLDMRSLSMENFENQKMPKFKLGNRVRIVGKDIRAFKMLHKNVGIWNEKMIEIIGKEAIVMNLSSVFMIRVSRVDNGKVFLVHGLALEIIKDEIGDGIWENTTDFKANDEVVIGVDPQSLGFLQQTVRKTPFNRAVQFVGLIARVVGFYENNVIVTFDEITYEIFHPDALRVYAEIQPQNKKKLSKLHSAKHENYIALSTQANMSTKMEDVMVKQKGHGGWHYQMTKFLGKGGVVTDNLPGGDVIVQFTPLESYRMNPLNVDVVKKEKNKRQRSKSGSFALRPFAVGDVVRLNMSSADLFSQLHLMRIPLYFASIVSSTAEFVGYADLKNGVIDYGDGTQLIFDLRLLVKAGDVMTERHKELKQLDNDIEVGKKVMLWVGPGSFAKTCVKTFKKGFEKALKDTATVKGYDERGSAVIKYANDDELYSVPGEYLCSPRNGWIYDNETVSFFHWDSEPIRVPTTVSSVEAKLLQSVSETLEINEETSTKWKSIIIEDPNRKDYRRIEIAVLFAIDNCAVFLDNMQKKLRSYKFEVISSAGGIIEVKADQQVYSMHFSFKSSAEKSSNDQESCISGSLTPKILERSLSITEDRNDDEHVSKEVSDPTLEDDASAIPEAESELPPLRRSEKSDIADNFAVPFGRGTCTISVPAGVRQVVIQLEEKASSTALVPKNSAEQRIDMDQPLNIIGNPVINNTVNMNLVGENKVDIDKSVVRKMTMGN